EEKLTSAEYPSPSVKKTGTTEQTSLTNHKPEPHVRSHPSKSTTLAVSLIIYCFLYVSVSGWLHIFLECHSNETRQRWWSILPFTSLHYGWWEMFCYFMRMYSKETPLTFQKICSNKAHQGRFSTATYSTKFRVFWHTNRVNKKW
uniref:L-serine-phosphatidylethanolamine phosphatidyltransferase n=1 Tax=Mesocestoides corti TaxID=53468 RepID=A0A5K3FP57_MESCO